MLYLKKILFVQILFIFLSTYGYSQCNNELLENYAQKEGLSQSTINCIYQDSHGFLWFGTQGGLNRFNGYSMAVYKNDPINSNSISGDFITAITEDQDGNIWVGTTNSGVSVFDPKTKNWKRFRADHQNAKSISDDRITTIYKDLDNNIWICTQNGLNQYQKNIDGFRKYYNPSPLSGNKNYFVSIVQDKHRNVYLLTFFTIEKLNPKDGSMKSVKIPDISGSFAWYQKILLDESGNIWFFSQKSKLCCFNTNTKQLTTFTITSKLFSDLTRYVNTGILKTGNKLLFTTYGKGIKSFDTHTHEFSDYSLTDNPEEKSFLKNVSALFFDKQSILWIGTYDKGIYKFDDKKTKFEHHKHDTKKKNTISDDLVWQIHEDKEGFLWFRTNSSLERCDNRNGIFAVYKYNTNGVFETKNRDLIISEGDIAYKFNFKSRKFDKLLRWPVFLNSKRITNIYRILEDKHKFIWLVSNIGLIRYNPAKKTINIYDHDDNNPKSLSDNTITNMFESSSGDIWIASSNGGLNRYNHARDEFDHFLYDSSDPLSIVNKKVYPLCEDSKKQIWAGTIGGGLYIIDSSGKVIKKYNSQHGLPDNSIAGIVIENENTVWISTFRGLCKLNPNTNEIFNFDLSDGLQSLDFNVLSYEKCKDGMIIFGGVNGYNTFYPEKIKYNRYLPPIEITKFTKINRISSSETELPISLVINLDYTENMFQIEFSALNYSNTGRNQFKYKLEGFDEFWTLCGTRRFAQYTNLDPGKYTFIVKASNNDGYWNEEGTRLLIIIKAPYWKRWWAYLLYIIIAVAMFVTIFKIDRKRYFRKQEEKIFKEREKAKLVEADLRLRTTELEMEAAKAQATAAETRAKMLRIESDRKTEELEEARKLQLSMLPKLLPKLDYIDFAVYNKTASEVGGDYYDFIQSSDNSMLMAFGDATGHGMKAGMMVSIIKSLFYSEIPWENFPQFFGKCTSIIKKMHLGNLYMGLCITEIKKKTMKISAAGMPPIYIYRSANDSIEEIRFRSMPLGAYENFIYEEKHFEFQSGDTILFLTDGLPDQFNENRETMDYEMIQTTFKNSANKNPQAIIADLLNLNTLWSQKQQQSDDITLIVLKVK